LLEDLNAEQAEIISSRQRIRKYLDMLSTYEVGAIYSKYFIAVINLCVGFQLILGMDYDIKYKPEFYAKFRSQSKLKSTVEFARNGDWEAVSAMLTYHSHTLLKHRLPIISSLPETINPHIYRWGKKHLTLSVYVHGKTFTSRSLLPECDEEEVLPWITESLRDQDWCESFYSR